MLFMMHTILKCSHLDEPLDAGLPVEGKDGVLPKALPDHEGVGEAQPEVAIPQDECHKVETSLHLLEVVEVAVYAVGLGVKDLNT